MFNKILVYMIFTLLLLSVSLAQDTNKDEEAIKAVLNQQSESYYQRNWDRYISVWNPTEDAIRLYGVNGRRIYGWDNVKDLYQRLFQNYPEPAKNLKIDNYDYNIQIRGNVAWVVNNETITITEDGIPESSDQWDLRILEKINDEWKISFTGVGNWLKRPDLTGPELWEKTIAYHDPKGVWEKFEGKVNIVTTHRRGTFSQERIEISKKDKFYSTTRLGGKNKIVRGVENGKAFHLVDGKKPTSTEIEQFNLKPERAKQFKEHHTCHIGLPMELKLSGVKVLDRVRAVEFHGKECYALSFEGDPEKVKHEYYAGNWTLYIDPDTYNMVGMDFRSDDWNTYFTAHGEIIVNGIKMPLTKNYFNSEDGSLRFTDNFTYVKE